MPNEDIGSDIEKFLNWVIEGTEYIAASKVGQGVVFPSQINEENIERINTDADNLYETIVNEVFSNRKEDEQMIPQDMADMIKAFLIKSAEYLSKEEYENNNPSS